MQIKYILFKMKNLIFLCIASAVFILSMIVLNFAPTINGLIGKGKYQRNGELANGFNGWADYPCKSFSDNYNYYKDKSLTDIPSWTDQEDKDYHLDLLKEGKNNCLKKKAMIGLEYSAFNINVIFGFACSILGLLLYSGNNIGNIVGLIGLGTGVIGFVLTFVYIVYSGIIFNNDVVNKIYDYSGDPYSSSYITTKSDGAYLEWKDGKYVCIFYDKDNKDKLYRKYSDYGNKYLNYYHFDSKNKDDNYYKYKSCSNYFSGLKGISFWKTCKDYDEGKNTISTKYKILDDNNNEKGECDKLYAIESNTTEEKKNLYNFWLTTIVLGCFIFVLDIGLAIFGFLIFKDSKLTPGSVAIN